KYLHLGELLTHWDDYLKLAGDQRFSHGRLLTHIVEEEYRVKRERLRELRLRKAHVPEPWVIETFPFDRQPKLTEKKIMALYDSLTDTLFKTGANTSSVAVKLSICDQQKTGSFWTRTS